MVYPSVSDIRTSNVNFDRPSVAALRQYTDIRSRRDAQLVRLSVVQVGVFISLYSVWTAFPLTTFIADRFGYFTYGSDSEGTISFLGTVGMHLLYVYASVSCHSSSQEMFSILSSITEHITPLYLHFKCISNRTMLLLQTSSEPVSLQLPPRTVVKRDQMNWMRVCRLWTSLDDSINYLCRARRVTPRVMII